MLQRILGGACAVLAGAALSAAGVAAPGAAGAAAVVRTQVTEPPVYDRTWAGYEAGGGRWFRFIATTVTIPARIIPAGSNGLAAITLSQADAPLAATIKVAPGGRPGSVTWAAAGHAAGRFALSPSPGDLLALSLYYDQQDGSDYFTAADLTQHVTQAVRVAVGAVVYDSARLAVAVAGAVGFPPTDVRLWQFTGSHLTTYAGDRGTITGPWRTSALTATVNSTARSAVKASPSFLWNGGQNFGLWLRAAPTAYAVTNGDAGTVTPIDTVTNTALPPIPVGNNPEAIAITPDGTTAYVVNQADGTVTPIDTATNTALKPISIGVTGQAAIAITPDGTTAYVATGDTVTPINIATNTALTPISFGAIGGSGTDDIAITPDSKTAYVVYDGETVIPINTATNTALKPIPLSGSSSIGIAITPDGTTAYVTSAVPAGEVTPINIATNTALEPIPAGSDAEAIAITPDGETAYVTGFIADTVTPINIATNTTLKPIPAGGGNGGPFVIAITPNGKTAYVLYQETNPIVTPINIATNTALPPIQVSSYTDAIAFTPDGATAYVTTGDTVTPIDTATNTALTPIPAGGPVAIAITP
jgi:YVTN family beta-propeller protein